MDYIEDAAWIWLAGIKKPANKTVEFLLNEYGDIKTLWEMTVKKEINNNVYNNKKIHDKIIDDTLKENAIKQYENSLNKKASITHLGKMNYPTELLNVFDRPIVLYYYGKLPDENQLLLSVVGSRKCTSYGKFITYKLCCELVERGVGIVSGLAHGIDTYAHKATIDNEGYTIAVLGGGPNYIYPKENIALYNEIYNKGCIISENPPDMPPFKENFPARNRIISGLCKATLVCEAGKSSGAMITVSRALEYNKEIFAIPGNIDSTMSEGCNDLIKNGATMVTSSDDILQFFEIETQKNKVYENECYFGLSGNETILMNEIIAGTHDVYKLIEDIDLDFNIINSTLSILELKGLIIRDMTGGISIKIKK